MKAVIQRVSEASVAVGGRAISGIGPGLLVLLCVEKGDGAAEADRLAAKIAKLRIFEDESGKMNRSVQDTRGAVLAVSQFTLSGDTSRGNRPDFTAAAPPEEAEALFDAFCAALADAGVAVERGQFRAHMEVALVNDGPVTIWIDSKK
ncbi:MAG: D-aminoacyl-tRNA deacylase [Alphaproteobacteria bacterium]